ncbi:MAG TPA: DMT family transporter [Verrucomicrobiae bacterium]|jgi:drug/metabolite transporter (DMT)-like permease
MSAENKRAKAIRILLFCTTLWGLSFPVMKALELTQQKLLPGADSWFLTSLGVMYRFGIAGLILSVIFFSQLKTISRRELEQGILIGLFGGGGILFQMDGVGYTAASTCAFLTQGYCVFIPLWVALAHRRLPSIKTFVSVMLVITGAAVLARMNLHELKLGRGELETLIASFLFTGQILCLEHPRYAANRAGSFSTIMFLVMALMCVPLVCATTPDAAACWRAYASLPAVGFLAILIIFCTLIAYTMMNYWQKFVTATEAGLIYCIEPVFASVLSLFLPALFSRVIGIEYANEQFTLRLLIGGGLILAANLLLQSKWLERKRDQSD